VKVKIPPDIGKQVGKILIKTITEVNRGWTYATEIEGQSFSEFGVCGGGNPRLLVLSSLPYMRESALSHILRTEASITT
jgi:hypothetical protein